MPLFFSVICDQCNTAAELGFSSASETYGGLLDEMRSQGWEVEINNEGEATKTLCPDHRAYEYPRPKKRVKL